MARSTFPLPPSHPRPVSGVPMDAHADDEDELGPPTETHEVAGLLGRGGMGEVRQAWDPRLSRNVALKSASSLATRPALLKEATLTARLEHPHIIPVYSAGRGPDGAPYYTMRLLPGRTLGDAIAEAPDLPARLRLVRHLVDAAGAVAYAHGQGVLHRDLKAGNVLVGGFGETVVADWGLACSREEGARGAGSMLGTPGAASPEQLRGDPVDERSDVYGLGAILYEICAGPGPRRSLRQAAPQAPPDLVAIAERALAERPEDRYPSAQAFEADLLAWYEGRRVAAHAYTPAELLRRLWGHYRLPIVVGAVGIVLVAFAVGFGLVRTAAQRDRAVSAESSARVAQAASERSLAAALLAQALAAATEDRQLEAELYASAALDLAESPQARGVLARFGGAPVVRLESRVPAPTCPRRRVYPGWLLCLHDDRLEAWRLPLDGAPPASVRVAVETTGVDADGETLLYTDPKTRLFAWRPPDAPVEIADIESQFVQIGVSEVPGVVALASSGGAMRLERATGELVTARVCAPRDSHETAYIGADGGLLVACRSGTIRRLGVDDPVLVLPAASGAPLGLRKDATTGRLYVGTLTGNVHFGAEGEPPGAIYAPWMASGTQRAIPRGGKLLTQHADGAIAVQDLATGVVLLHVGEPGMSAAWSLDGLAVDVVGRHAERWTFPAEVGFRSVVGDAGASDLELSPDGSTLAVALGNGTVELRSARSGGRFETIPVSQGVVKDVVFDGAGTSLGVAIAAVPGWKVLRAPGWVTAQEGPPGCRRVAWTSALGFLLASYDGGLEAWPSGARYEVGVVRDAATSQGGEVAVVELDGGLQILGPSGAWRGLGSHPGTTALTWLGSRLALGRGDQVVVLAGEGAEVGRWRSEAELVEILGSPDGSLLAGGRVDGSIALWDAETGRLVAILSGHEARVSGLAFSADGRTLYSASWDHTVRRWSTGELGRSGSELRAELEARWGRTFAEILPGAPASAAPASAGPASAGPASAGPASAGPASAAPSTPSP